MTRAQDYQDQYDAGRTAERTRITALLTEPSEELSNAVFDAIEVVEFNYSRMNRPGYRAAILGAALTAIAKLITETP
jgi:hypothetical protein